METVSIFGKFVPWSAILAVLLAGSSCGGGDSDAVNNSDSSTQDVAGDTGSASSTNPDCGHESDSDTSSAPDTDLSSDTNDTDTSDVDTSRDRCADLENGCDVEGLSECSAEGSAVRRCLADENGCFYWEETKCQEGWVCVSGDEGALCRAPAEELWKFVVVGDSRGWLLGVNTAAWGHLVDAIVDENPEFVLFPGDLTDDGKSSQFDRWIKTTRPLYDADIFVYSVRGNHDDESLSDWNDAFSGEYGFPQNGPVGEKNLTYSFTHKNAFVVGIDNYSGSRKVNQDWLDVELAQNTEPHVFVFGHEPAFAAHHQDCLDDNPAARDDFWESIVQAGGRAYFAGHDHFYDHARVDDRDGDPVDDVHQFIVGTAGAPLYDFGGEYTGLNSRYRPVQEYFAKQYGYMVVEVDDMDVRMTFKERSGDSYVVKDSFSYSLDLVDYCPDDPDKTKPGSCGCGVPDGTCGDPISQRLALTPDADAYVSGADPGKNFGGAGALLVDKAPDEYETLLRFTVPELTAELKSATIRLFVTNGSDNGPKVYLTDNGWTESEVTYNNRPGAFGGALDDIGDTPGGWVEFDVTGAIKGSGDYSFLLLPDDTDGADFDSREAANSPELVVFTGE